ncbi:hypothetical protein ES705_44037 [subsurface metagenome]
MFLFHASMVIPATPKVKVFKPIFKITSEKGLGSCENRNQLHILAFCYIKIVDYSEKVRSYAKSTCVSKNTADTVLYTMAGVVQAFFFRYTFLGMSLFFSAWQLVIRRSLANWRLLSFMMVGVLVAVALLSQHPPLLQRSR